MVLQRDQNNRATVSFSGGFSEIVDRVEVQFRALNGGQTSDWITISENPTGGYFSGKVVWTAGWYQLEARGIYRGQVIGAYSIPRVGIGDVFIVAGQSNAQGYLNYGAKSAADDRVNCVNYYNANTDHTELPNPDFAHLDADSYIAPRGNSAWGWGRLGDQITRRTGFPVLFYNVGWYGSGSRNWQESISGTTLSVYDGRSPYEPSGMPFGNLRLVMKYYVPITGVRAVLWQQGEADNFANVSKDSYAFHLRTVINQIRQETSKDISWVIARSSHDNVRGSNPNITGAQSEIIATIPNTFPGPETDNIQIPRIDGAHFQNEGLEQMGDAWGNSLGDNFWAQSKPYQAVPIPTLSVSCQSDYSISLSIKENYSSIRWNTNETAQTIRVGGGYFTAKLEDSSGNIVYLPPFFIPDVRKPQTPFISASRSTDLCQGELVTLQANGTINGFAWNSGQDSGIIEVNSSGDYFVTNRNGLGCVSTSNVMSVRVAPTPPPARPEILVSGATTFCENEQVTLSVNGDNLPKWSTGESTTSILVRTSGVYKVRVIDTNGCSSAESAPVEVKVNPLPATPVLSLSGSSTICEGESVTISSSYATGNQWSNQSTEASVTVTKSGSYFVNVKDLNGCVSPASNPVSITVNAAPEVPGIRLSGPNIFCEGESVTLTASGSEPVVWSNGSNSVSILVGEAGTFYAKAVNANGCFSGSSAKITTEVKPAPGKPLLTKVGTYTLEASTTDQGTIFYEWRKGDMVIQNSANRIKAIESGSFTVKTYQISELGTKYCNSPVSDALLFIPEKGTNGLSIFPNPVTDRVVKLETLEDLRDARIELFDLSGNRLQSYFVEELNEQKSFSISSIPQGVYLIRVTSGKFSATQKLIVH